MIEFILLIGGLIAITWVVSQVFRAIIKVPGKIIYHASGQAERDKNALAMTKVKRAEQKIQFEREESERKSRQIKEFALEVEAFKAIIVEKEIMENTLVVIRRGNSTMVDIAKYKELSHYSSFQSPNPMHYAKSDELRPGWMNKQMNYVVYSPIVKVNVVENKSFISNDFNSPYQISDFSIAKATPEFAAIFDEKVNKPLREKEEAEQVENLKLINAKNKLDSMFK